VIIKTRDFKQFRNQLNASTRLLTDGIDWTTEDFEDMDAEAKAMLADQTRVGLLRDVIADVVGKRCGGGGWVDADASYFYERTIAQQRLELSSIINDSKVAFANL
jgi:hypothetical protein